MVSETLHCCVVSEILCGFRNHVNLYGKFVWFPKLCVVSETPQPVLETTQFVWFLKLCVVSGTKQIDFGYHAHKLATYSAHHTARIWTVDLTEDAAEGQGGRSPSAASSLRLVLQCRPCCGCGGHSLEDRGCRQVTVGDLALPIPWCTASNRSASPWDTAARLRPSSRRA